MKVQSLRKITWKAQKSNTSNFSSELFSTPKSHFGGCYNIYMVKWLQVTVELYFQNKKKFKLHVLQGAFQFTKSKWTFQKFNTWNYY